MAHLLLPPRKPSAEYLPGTHEALGLISSIKQTNKKPPNSPPSHHHKYPTILSLYSVVFLKQFSSLHHLPTPIYSSINSNTASVPTILSQDSGPKLLFPRDDFQFFWFLLPLRQLLAPPSHITFSTWTLNV
jgi:hypothetical protein